MSDNQCWLSAQQQQVWSSYLRASAKIYDHLDTRLREHGLGLSEYEILFALSQSPNQRLRMSDLADLVHHSRSRLTHCIARMEDDGLVKRVSCPSDRRGVNAELTANGRAKLQAAAPDHVRAVRAILVDVVHPDDFAAMGRIWATVLELAD